MSDLLMLLLLVIAIAIGYFLGRASTRKKNAGLNLGFFSQNYFKGLNQLLNEEPDAAIDTFIEALEVNSDTLETHLALGNLLRRQGEVDRAIRIHQNLLARPGLSSIQQHHAQLELARDYVKAGLFDRAERLFLELVDRSAELRNTCLEGLIEIYRDEKEWGKAIATVEQLVGRRFSKAELPKWRRIQAHFCCELAEQAMEQSDLFAARRHAKAALTYDKDLVRASLLWAQLEHEQGNNREAVKILRRVPLQDADFVSEMLPLLVECYEALGDYDGLEKTLEQLQEDHPSNSIILELTERIRRRHGDMAAASYIASELKIRPSARGVSKLLDFYIKHSKEKAQDNLRLLKELIDQIMVSKPSYRCEQCGFPGNQLHWLCPSCKSWNTVKPVRGVEGE